MTCREAREEIRRSAARGPGEEALRHIALCPGCAAEARASLLLRLGSERADDAAPRPGFEDRLRARLAAESRGRTASPAWSAGFETLVRPALAMAAVLVVLSAAWYATAPQENGDLASLVETDAVYASAIAVSPDAVFAAPGEPAAEADQP